MENKIISILVAKKEREASRLEVVTVASLNACLAHYGTSLGFTTALWVLAGGILAGPMLTRMAGGVLPAVAGAGGLAGPVLRAELLSSATSKCRPLEP